MSNFVVKNQDILKIQNCDKFSIYQIEKCLGKWFKTTRKCFQSQTPSLHAVDFPVIKMPGKKNHKCHSAIVSTEKFSKSKSEKKD